MKNAGSWWEKTAASWRKSKSAFLLTPSAVFLAGAPLVFIAFSDLHPGSGDAYSVKRILFMVLVPVLLSYLALLWNMHQLPDNRRVALTEFGGVLLIAIGFALYFIWGVFTF